MSEASKRTAQQQRIQQLQERLELYNAAATRSELPSTASAAASTGRAAKPTRAPPPINSPNANATDTAQPVLSPLFSTGGVPVSAAAPTTTGPAATREEPIRVSPAPQTRTYESPPAPAPAPRLARNLAEDFVSSAASSPVGAPAVSSTRTSPFTAASPPPPRPATTTTTTTTTSASAAPAATSPLHASQVFGYYTESDEDDDGDDEGEYVEYEVEEVEEYQEDEEDDDYTEEEEEEENIHDGSQPTLDNVLRRIFKAYSGSPDRASSNPQAERAALSSQEYVPEFLASSKARVGTAGAAASASSTHPLIQRAAELYRQHRLHQAQQHHHSPFHTSEDDAARAHPTAAGRGALDGSSVSTSEPTAELEDDGSGSETTATSTSSDSYLSPAAAYAALNLGGATSLVSRAASAAAAAAAGVAEKSASPSSTAAGVASSLPMDSSTFNQLETAYRQLLLVQRGVEYAVQRTGIQHFPDPLPHQEKAQTLAQERNALVQKDMEMRAAAPEGPSLVDVRAHEAAALEAAIDAIYAKFAAAMQVVQPVVDRSATVEDKMRLLKQREMELAQQREARIIVEREVVKQESLLGERKERMRRREAEYNAQLQQHDEQQKTAQQHIGEVEQLSKQVSSWLAILEERDRRLAQKEKRLQHVQADLLRRNEDVLVWKKATQRVKQIPPPPSPPRIR